MSKPTASVQIRANPSPQQVANPCVRNCCLDDGDVCLGCFRTLDEILAWRSFSNKQREEVLMVAEKRRALNAG